MAQIIKTSILEVPSEEAAARLAVLQLQGVGINKIVQLMTEEFGYQFTRAQLKRYEHKEVYVRTVKEYKDNLVKKAVVELKAGTSKLVPKIIEAIEKALDNGNINAITHALKILGVETIEPENKQAQSITVVLPGKAKERQVGEA